MLSGSVALSIYTLSRATKGFDFIVNIKEDDVRVFVKKFHKGYYCDEDSIREAIKQKGIDHSSGFKADFIVLKNLPYRQTEFKRRCEVDFMGTNVFVVSPEDLLISKLIWIQDYQSGIQMEDIKALMRYEKLDFDYLNLWNRKLELNNFNLI